MQKKLILLIVIGIVVVLPIAWYLISPIFRVVQVNEPSPFDDMLEKMDANTKKRFEQEVNTMKDKAMVIDDSMPFSTKAVKQGTFMPRAHDVQGKAILIEKDGKKIIRFENFETINGPDLHIYLSSGLGNKDYIDLGKIKATKGNVNYEVPSNTDINKYDKVLVWCEPFSVLFSYAKIS